MNRDEHFGGVETWASKEPTRILVETEIRMGIRHAANDPPMQPQLAGAYHCGPLPRAGLVLHLAAGQCLRDVLRWWMAVSPLFFSTCLVERTTVGLKVKSHPSSQTTNNHHQPSKTTKSTMLKDAFPTLVKGDQHGLKSR